MTAADMKAFAKGLMALGEAMDAPVSEARADAYFLALSDMSLEDLNTAFRIALRSCRFFPKPVELREMVHGRIEDDAEEGWALAVDAARRVGSYMIPDLPPHIESTIRAVFGDWRNFCACEIRGPEGIGWRKQFVQAYEVYARREQRGQYGLTAAESKKALADIRSRMLPQNTES